MVRTHTAPRILATSTEFCAANPSSLFNVIPVTFLHTAEFTHAKSAISLQKGGTDGF